MSVGEWLNTVIEPTDDAEDQAWSANEADRGEDRGLWEKSPDHDEPRGRHRRRGRWLAPPWRRDSEQPQPQQRAFEHDEAPRHDDHEAPRQRGRKGKESRRQNFHAERKQRGQDWRPPPRWREHHPDAERQPHWQGDEREQQRDGNGNGSRQCFAEPHEAPRGEAPGDWDARPRHHRHRHHRHHNRDDMHRPEDLSKQLPEDLPRAVRRAAAADHEHGGQGASYRAEPERAEMQRAEIQRAEARRAEAERAEAERAERQRQNRALFEQAAASIAAEQRRDAMIDDAVAEITARQRALENVPVSAAAPTQSAAPAEPERAFAPWPDRVTVDMSGLEQQLREMTARLEALRPSAEIETAITGLRADLAEISRSFTEALPRRALESLEIEIKALGERIDHSREAGVDLTALAGVERGLAEVHEALRGLTPAEGLIGFDDAIRALSGKVDAIANRGDSAALQQLETAIDSLRGIVGHVASSDALGKVAEDVRALAGKVDGLASSGTGMSTLTALENRIDILASALNASTEAGHAVPRELERLLSGLIDKIERLQLTTTDHTALGHLEDRIAALVKRLDTSDARLGLLEGVERGLADLLVYIDQVRAANAAGAAVRPAPAGEPTGFSAEQTRGDAEPPAARDQGSSGAAEPAVERAAAAMVAASAVAAEVMGGELKAAAITPPPAPTVAPAPNFAPAPAFSPAHDVASYASDQAAVVPAPLASEPASRPAASRTPIDPNLPPDHPLEPGVAARSRQSMSAAERIAASEGVAPSKPPVIPDPGSGKADFIAAARRAAQAAAAAPDGRRATKTSAQNGAPPKKFTDRVRAVAVAAAVVVIVVGGFHIISRLFEDGSSGPPAQVETPRKPAAPQELPSQGGGAAPPAAQPAPAQSGPPQSDPPHVEAEPQPSAPSAAAPSLPIPAPAADPAQNSNAPPNGPSAASALMPPSGPSAEGAAMAPSGPPAADPVAAAPALPLGNGADAGAPAAPATPGVPLDITGSLPNKPAAAGAASPHGAHGASSSADKLLPAAIGGPTLRIAAIAGDPLAAYEIGQRFTDGRLVPINNEEAARWFDIAAKKGIVPAQFRLATLYEKGLGVKKDLVAARNLYRAAADKGHGKAMHNLAVLYAEGGDGKPDYQAAAEWFRKAADHGISDSQYNLAILYARGVGVEQNLAESYKWFYLAAKDGDNDAAQKRDEIAGRLDPQTLAAARAAAESFTAIPQPPDATTVKGNWDSPTAAPAVRSKSRAAKATAPQAPKLN